MSSEGIRRDERWESVYASIRTEEFDISRDDDVVIEVFTQFRVELTIGDEDYYITQTVTDAELTESSDTYDIVLDALIRWMDRALEAKGF